MAEDRHRAVQHRSAVPGVEAVTASTDRSFPRHAHDHLGFGVVDFGAHRSWSGIGAVEAAAASGFADQSHLTRAFLHQFGVTPGRYRAALR